jgi:hypothetical protein
MKRLLLVTTSYPDQNEGAAAGSFVADFAAELVRQDVAVTVVAPARAASVVSEQCTNAMDNPTIFWYGSISPRCG